MIQEKSRGYIGLIVIMIVCAIIAYLMMKEFVNYGVLPEEKSSMFQNTNTQSSQTPQTPIEKAQNIKGVLEAQDRNVFNQAEQ